MQEKLTITIDEEVYEGLHKTIGPHKISRYIQEIVRPHVLRPNLESAYAEMAKDKERETLSDPFISNKIVRPSISSKNSGELKRVLYPSSKHLQNMPG
jgi:hypothetical protein